MRGTIQFYGITQDPVTSDYALVFELKNCSLRSYLNQNYNLMTWKMRLSILECICTGLQVVHDCDLVHKDLHINNILINELTYFDDAENLESTCITDFGFCRPANEVSSHLKIYGVMPYMAPEVLRGGPYTASSDIYSLGVIINEVISITPPFNKESHDHYLALDICRGRRPEISEETPEFLRELIQKCWDANPENRPSSWEIATLLNDFKYTKGEKNNEPSYEYTEQYKKLITSSYNFTELTKQNSSKMQMQLKTHPQAIYTSRLISSSNLPEPMNCQDQEEFVSSRDTVQVQTGEFIIVTHFLSFV